ncbi:MAG: DUF2339 domain-containing protein [Desulfamplus sp.]|nr:DUF2339 domain-containing protein [Desulfamplus sp.]
MRYIFTGIVFAVLIGFIPHYSYSRNEIFGFIFGLFFAEIVSLRKRILLLEKPHLQPAREDTHQEGAIPASSSEQPASSEDNFDEHYKTEVSPPENIRTTKERKNGEFFKNIETFTPKKSSLTALIARIKEFFTTGNVVLKLGIIIIFFGVSFLLKYAAQRNLIPIEFRLAGVVIFAIGMLVTGWSMSGKEARNNRDNEEQNGIKEDITSRSEHRKYGSREYGVVLQGGGVGILYLTVFAASKLYNFLPNTFSMILMILLVALSGALAVMQDAKSLAVSGIIGGFLAPVLMSTGSGSHVMLFSYYALLNCGILGIAWFKAWRELNLLGFVFTFIISALWGSEHYRPEFFSTTEPFLILFFLFYAAISVLFAHRQPPKLKGFIDGPLVFGLPLVVFGLQSALVSNIEYGLAISALTLGLFYIILATVLWNRLVEGMRMLTEAFIAIGVVFGTLAIPLALDGRWTSTAWALEGAAMVWVGVRQNRLLARLFGILLQFGAGIAFLAAENYYYFFANKHFYNYVDPNAYFSDASNFSNAMPFLNQIYLGAVFISIAGLFSSYYMVTNREKLRRWENSFHIPLLLWGVVWWFGGGLYEIDSYVSAYSDYNEYHLFLVYCAVSCQLMSMIANHLKWHQLMQSMMLFLPVIFCTLALELFDLFGRSHLFAKWGSVAWIITFAVQYRLLWQFDHHLPNESYQTPNHNPQEFAKTDNIQGTAKTEKKSFRLTPWQHLITLWILMFVLSHETVWAVRQFFNPTAYSSFDLFGQSSTWSGIFWGIVPAISILLIIKKGEMIKWPIGRHQQYYFNQGLTCPASFLILWILWTNFYDGNPAPLPYIPLVNPLELSQIFVLLVLTLWAFRGLGSSLLLNKKVVLLLLLFIWLNFVTGRVVHFYFNVPFYFSDLTDSVVFQAGISILWGVVALFTTAFAARTRRRRMWFAGAFLLGLLVLKLFTVDLSGIRTIARIVSFLAVGGLMLLIGYISPLPPKEQKEFK